MIVGTFIFGLAFGFYGFAWLSAPERARARRRMERLQLRADVSVAATAAMRRERDEAMRKNEPTPIYDSLHFEQWEAEL